MKSSPSTISIRTTGTNLLRAKSHNHRVVLDVVRTQGPLSRAEIARKTLLSRQTIQNIVKELHELGLVEFSREQPRAKRRGHPGVKVQFCARGGYSLGIHLDQFSLKAVMTDLVGNILWQEKYGVVYPDPDMAVSVIRGILQTLKDEKPQESSRLMHIGLALPGPFNISPEQQGDPTSLPKWSEPQVVDYLTDSLGMPVIVENDASAAAVGESLFGNGDIGDSFIYIYFGLGLGAGIFLDGGLYRGELKNAGEIGHMVVELDGEPCSCGRHGCLERYVSLHSIYDSLAIPNPTEESLATVSRLFAENDSRVEQWLARAIPRLHQAVSCLTTILDISTVVFGGKLPRPMIEIMVARLTGGRACYSPVNGGRGLRVAIGASGPDATTLGAAALAVAEQISPQVGLLLKE